MDRKRRKSGNTEDKRARTKSPTRAESQEKEIEDKDEVKDEVALFRSKHGFTGDEYESYFKGNMIRILRGI